MNVDFTHPANAALVSYLRQRGHGRRAPPDCSPETLGNLYFNLGTHPDIVERLWHELGGRLPPCAWVVYGTPVLVHLAIGVLFAFAQGTGPYALRLPPKERAKALAAARRKAEQHAEEHGLQGAARERYLAIQSGRVWEYVDGEVLDLNDISEEWVFGRWLGREAAWCKSAFDFAGMEPS
jgi:hypothetical protein